MKLCLVSSIIKLPTGKEFEVKQKKKDHCKCKCKCNVFQILGILGVLIYDPIQTTPSLEIQCAPPPPSFWAYTTRFHREIAYMSQLT